MGWLKRIFRALGSEPKDSDSDAVEALRRSGADLTIPHDVQFRINGPKGEGQDGLVRALQAQAYSVQSDAREFIAAKMVVPTVQNVHHARGELLAICDQYGARILSVTIGEGKG